MTSIVNSNAIPMLRLWLQLNMYLLKFQMVIPESLISLIALRILIQDCKLLLLVSTRMMILMDLEVEPLGQVGRVREAGPVRIDILGERVHRHPGFDH